MKRTLLTPDAISATPLKETSQQTIQRLSAENAELKGQLKKYINAELKRTADEKIIVEKMAHGLSRQQAINVIHRQREFDTAPKAKITTSKPKSKVKTN
jgi:hypothetical protein